MASSTSKRVLVVRFDRESVPGFIDHANFLRPSGIELLTPAGSVSVLPYADVKAICFVKDLGDPPSWKENRLFVARPKTEGLWVRFHFKDGDLMDGLLPHNLLSWEVEGFTVAPADPTFQNQRVFLPKTALTETKLMGVVGAQTRQFRRPKSGLPENQLEMFEK